MRIWGKKRESMLCWMTVNWIIVVKSGNSSLKYIDLNESLVKEEREYVMLNECKLYNSC